MAKNINYVSHKKSKVKSNGKPQLPQASALVEGEIAVNYAENVETLSIKNESGSVVTFSSDNYYTEQKLGSGFTGANSAKTVTDVIVSNERVIAAALTDVDKKLGSGFSESSVTDTIKSISGKSITQIESSNSSISAKTVTSADGTAKYDLTTDASKISGLTAVNDSDEGAAKISGVTSTDNVKTGIKRLYDSLASEIAARKASIAARTIESANKAINVSETPNGDGFNTILTLTLDGTTNGTGTEKTGNDNALTITDKGLFLSSKWDCGVFN